MANGKIKKFFLALGGAALAVLGFLLGRRSNGSGIGRASDLARDARDGNQQLGSGLERSEDIAERIGDRIESAEGHSANARSANRRAREIIENAKTRSQNKD